MYCSYYLDCVRRFVGSGDNVGEAKLEIADFALLLILGISNTRCLLADLSRGGRGIPDIRSSDFLGGEALFSLFASDFPNTRSSLLLLFASTIGDITEDAAPREAQSYNLEKEIDVHKQSQT